MSRSEKMIYRRDRSHLFPLEDPRYKSVLEQRLGDGRSDEQGSILRKLVNTDRHLLYEMTARYVPMQTDEIILLLNSFIEEEKNGNAAISESGERALEIITNALQQRAQDLLNETRLVEAAGICFSILVSIEPELCHVYDEGWTYQCIMNDTFELLQKIGGEDYGLETQVVLVYTATHFFTGINENDRYYENRWKEFIAAVGR